MDCQLQLIDYASTGYFSSLVIDFLKDDKKLTPFYAYSSQHPDFINIIQNRQKFTTNRKLLVSELREQYTTVNNLHPKTADNIELLSQENTFAICTAHQPNLFTGYLYFVYKILQAIKLADELQQKYPAYHFVPVYFMGSEDNDLDELSIINLDGQPIRWKTSQTGAFGRMHPEGLEELIKEVSDHLGTGDHAQKIITLLQEAYLHHADMQTATLYLVNALFGEYGLVTLIPDRPAFKKTMAGIFKEELLQQTAFPIVSKTNEQLAKHYPIQAHPREINLFYLKDNLRERIIKKDDHWKVNNTHIVFNEKSLLDELEKYPDRFSPNAILRGLLQEILLPNIAFIGGGGEIAYWMELKDLFDHHHIPYPLLLLRNSFLWVNKHVHAKVKKLPLSATDLFKSPDELIRQYVLQHDAEKINLDKENGLIRSMFMELTARAKNIDITLVASVNAEYTKVQRSLDKISLKFLRGEKKKHIIQSQQLQSIHAALFPNNSLQERRENLLPYYAVYGMDFIDTIYKKLTPLSNQFSVLLID